MKPYFLKLPNYLSLGFFFFHPNHWKLDLLTFECCPVCYVPYARSRWPPHHTAVFAPGHPQETTKHMGSALFLSKCANRHYCSFDLKQVWHFCFLLRKKIERDPFLTSHRTTETRWEKMLSQISKVQASGKCNKEMNYSCCKTAALGAENKGKCIGPSSGWVTSL